jgi:hypothetical protein
MITPKYCYLRLRCIADQAVTVKARVNLRRQDGTNHVAHLTGSTVAADSEQVTDDTVQLGAGFITDATIYHDQDSSYIRPGQIYAVLDLVVVASDSTILGFHVICGGHLGGGKFISRGFYEPPQAHTRIIRPSNPAAGANLQYTLPDALMLEELQTMRFRMVTDANVANRRAVVAGRDGTGDIWATLAVTTQAASLTRDYYWTANTAGTGALSGEIFNSWITGLPVPNSGRLDVRFDSIQATDQISSAAFTGRWRWIMDTLS